MHKFAEKYCVKGSWDATGKLVKAAILKNEMKHERCANAFDCYTKLKADLSKNGTEKLKQKWLEWEVESNEKILTKTPLTTQRIFIGFSTEYKEDFDCLQAAGHDHIIFIDRASIPDMKALVGTQKVL